MFAKLAIVSALVATVLAHGNITVPPCRLAGAAMAKACGQAGVSAVQADGTIPLEDVKVTGANCNLSLCRGAVFEDNKDRLQTFKAGQVIQMKAAIPIPHEGPCNVSIIDTKSNKAIGQPLIFFDSYADEKLPKLPANNTAFSVTMPKLKANQCTTGGECVLQWNWVGTAAKQTYQSCVDFVQG
ncbi:hypothetical protein MCOR14_001934 [Pyricularia oryzae]|nr:hypothetical protein MCOR19_006906 [Pyricularia oryzae]KAI6456468.1 hypothetical protein MCOR15_007228 [Pyricularia oryzae]KAI6490364.1 hypothetical protein MCOR18_002381 [Pyricularia oryzae]KAI6507856.1 hypothetical protein MCOR13_002504 [Pyricularia oryzae]KAI6540219.1 hypothetical protein MCOR16_001056 [Pyricularia oryzae]